MSDDDLLENARITTNGDNPAVELPNGERLTFKVQINAEEMGAYEEPVDHETEVVTDDFSWWHLFTDQGDFEVVVTPQIGHHNADD